MSLEIDPQSRVVAVFNPHSTHAEKKGAVVGALDDSAFWASRYIEYGTRFTAVEDNAYDLAELIEPGDILLGGGGDGLNNTVATALMLAEQEDTAFIPLPLGEGNDLSKSIYGRNVLKRQRFMEILQYGDSHPLDVMRIDTSDQKTHHAFSYFGIGITALAAAKIDAEAFRERKHVSRLPDKVHGAVESWHALREREPFRAEVGPNGEERLLQELLFASQPRMAGGAIRLDIDPFGKEVICIELGARFFLANVATRLLASPLTHGLRGRPISEVEFTVLDPVGMQCDGEPHRLKAETNIRVSHQLAAAQVLV